MVRYYNTDDIPAVYRLEEIPSVTVRDGVEQRVFRGNDSMLGFTEMSPDLELGTDVHPWEQICYVAEGASDFHIGEEAFPVEAGEIFFIPPGVEHYANPSGYDDPVVLVDAWPLREDYLSRTTYQTEFQ